MLARLLDKTTNEFRKLRFEYVSWYVAGEEGYHNHQCFFFGLYTLSTVISLCTLSLSLPLSRTRAHFILHYSRCRYESHFVYEDEDNLKRTSKDTDSSSRKHHPFVLLDFSTPKRRFSLLCTWNISTFLDFLCIPPRSTH